MKPLDSLQEIHRNPLVNVDEYDEFSHVLLASFKKILVAIVTWVKSKLMVAIGIRSPDHGYTF